MAAESEDRLITQRANYLSRSTDLRENIAEAIAWSERGYARSSIARELETSKSTVKGWHERAMAQYGLEIVETLTGDQLEPPLSEPSYEGVGAEYLDELQTRADKERWLECVQRNADKLPASWVNDVLERAQREGYLSVGDD